MGNAPDTDRVVSQLPFGPLHNRPHPGTSGGFEDEGGIDVGTASKTNENGRRARGKERH